jgi:pimeloyl-ACP methyl ester carboxylesterase
MGNDSTSGYVGVNGLRIYYEVHGTGRPLLLLHGAFGTIESCFAGLMPDPERISERRAPRRASGRLAERIRAP